MAREGVPALTRQRALKLKVGLVSIPTIQRSVNSPTGVKKSDTSSLWSVCRFRGPVPGRFGTVPGTVYLSRRHAIVKLLNVAGPCSTPQDWPWSSTKAHLYGQHDQLVCVKPMLMRVSNWRKYLADTGEATDQTDAIQRHSKTGRPLYITTHCENRLLCDCHRRKACSSTARNGKVPGFRPARRLARYLRLATVYQTGARGHPVEA